MKVRFFCGAVITAATKLGYTAYFIDDEHPSPEMGWLSPDGSACISTELGVKRAAHCQLAFEVMQEMKVDAGTGSDSNQRFFTNDWIRKNGVSDYEFRYTVPAVETVEMDTIRTHTWSHEIRLDVWVGFGAGDSDKSGNRRIIRPSPISKVRPRRKIISKVAGNLAKPRLTATNLDLFPGRGAAESKRHRENRATDRTKHSSKR
jgi:hypothetical protein